MRAHRLTTVLIAVLIGLAIVLAAWPRPKEPVYNNRPLSYWTGQLAGNELARSFDAIRAIGPDGVPFLLRKVRKEHSLHRRVYAAAWSKLPNALKRHLPAPRSTDEADRKVIHALSILDAPGVPALVAAFQDRNSSVRRVAAEAIGRMLLSEQVEQESAPGLAKLLSDPDDSVRSAAISTLEKMGSDAKAAIPGLTLALRHPKPPLDPIGDLGFKALAARLLGEMGPEANGAVPDLLRLTADPDRAIRTEAAMALWRIKRDTNGLPLLVEALARAPLFESQQILSALGQMGPAADAAVPVILKKLDEPGTRPSGSPESSLAREALRRIDPEAGKRLRTGVR
jgi:HEAT repeat protein